MPADTAIVRVDDPDDPRLDLFRRNDRGLASRAERRDDEGAGLFLAEGELVVERALDAGCRAVAALVDPDAVPAAAERLGAAGADVYGGGPEVRRLVTGLGMLHSVVATFRRPARPAAADLAARCQRLVVLEGVDNPANVGAVVRNAAALGWDGLVLDNSSADPLARRALRVAMGTAFSLPHARTPDLAGLVRSIVAPAPGGAANGGHHTVIALTPDPDALDIAEIALEGPRAVLIGAERSGLSPGVMGAATLRVRIPMAGGVDSLNAAAATAIACFALRR